MIAKKFSGGIHLPYYKELSRDEPIEKGDIPSRLIIPLSQHIGSPCSSLVEEGDRVQAGDVIGRSEEFVYAPVHSGADGVVEAIEQRENFAGDKIPGVVIKVDEDGGEPEYEKVRDPDSASREEIISAVREAGIAGMGGAAFPTAVKLQPPEDKEVDTVIINGCECEPFLTCDFRMMLEEPQKILKGAEIIRRTVEAEECYIAIEDNKMEAVEKLRSKNSSEMLKVVEMPTVYPQGAEKNLIEALLGREVPSGGLPFDVGVLVQNVGTTAAVYDAVCRDKPLTERVVTVTGNNLENPSNLMVKIGTPISTLIEQCGGAKQDSARVVVGGPMTGFAQSSLEVPVVKGTTGIIVMMPEDLREDDYRPCIKCEQCIEHCPVRLYPNFISMAYEDGDINRADSWDAMDCIECGICSYVCRSYRPLLKHIKLAKAELG